MIAIEHVSHEFAPVDRRGEATVVLDDVDLAIADGTFVSVLGPSGCGKTTLLRIVHGLIRPARGRILIDGQVVERPSADRAMVFQEFNLLPWRTVQQNAELGLEVQGVDAPTRQRLARAALDLVGLGQFVEHRPHQLSGGMKQRLGLARALCTAPRYLLMDEPFGALDLQTRELMQIELMRLWEADRKTVLFVTHSVDEAILLSDRVVVLGARPASVLRTVTIDLPRPRWGEHRALRESTAFGAYRQRIWQLLEQQPLEVAGSRSDRWR